MKILNRYTNEVIYEDKEIETIRELVEQAIKSGARLKGADLKGADLSSADLNGLNLSSADLSGSNLNNACLNNACLSSADLRGACLSSADLRGADLSSAVGNNREIITLFINKYTVVFTRDTIQIGCKNYSIESWKNFSDEEILEMDSGALKWWKKWKDFIFLAIELSKED